MSIDVMVAVYRAKLGKRGTETAMVRKAVALKLADCAHDDGRSIHPSIKRIADEVEISERSVQRVIAGFLDEKLLLLDNEGWSGKTNRYRFNFNALSKFPRTRPRPEDEDDGTGDTMTPMSVKQGDTVTSKGDPVSPRGDPVTPKPSLNHQEPSKQQRSRKSKSEKGKKMNVDPITGISAKALGEGYALAEGWDRAELLDKFLDLPEPGNPDAAWIGFCRRMGTHEMIKARRFKSSVAAEDLAKYDPTKPATVRRGDASWQPWLDTLLMRGARALASQIETAGAMDAPHCWPQQKCSLPRPVKRERASA